MRILAYTALALRSLRAHMLRSFLTTIGITIGIASVLIVVALAEGARAEVTRQINSLGSHLLVIQPGAQNVQGVRQQTGTILSLTKADALAVAREVPDVLIAAPFVGEQKTVVAGNVNRVSLVAGVTPDYFTARDWTIAEGEPIDSQHVDLAAKVAVIGHTVMHELFHDGEAIGRAVRIGRTSYAVIGVLAEKGQDFTGRDQDDVIFLPLSSARIFTIGRSQVSADAVHTILVKTDSDESMAQASTSITRLLEQRHKIIGHKADDFKIQNLTQVVQTRDRAYQQFTLLVSTLAGISLLVGGIGVMNIMLVSVAERAHEIATRVVVGARPQDIREQFLLEATLLCLIGGLIGVAIGYVAAQLIHSIIGWPAEFNEMMALIALACAGVIGVAFGMLPAERAARLDPAVVLRSA